MGGIVFAPWATAVFLFLTMLTTFSAFTYGMVRDLQDDYGA